MKGTLALATAVLAFFIALIFTTDFIYLLLIYWVTACFSYMAWDAWVNYLKTTKKTEC